MGARPGWSFLTGEAEDIEFLRRKLGMYDPDPAVDADRAQHGAILVYGNDAKQRWSAIPALFESRRIVNAVLGTMR